ncbi:MAG: Tex-like N-terminal domain-containing protein, partial [Bacteroidota bacterium]
MATDNITRWVNRIAQETGIPQRSVLAAALLLEEGGTIPFIARYRKEKTGGLDEVQIGTIRDRLTQLEELDKRRESILSAIEKQGKLTPDLIAAIVGANSLAELEDIYLPYRPRRKTRASVAREKGLEPLALELLNQESTDPEHLAAGFINQEAGVSSTEEALAGARDIIAEMANENPETRKAVRELFRTEGVVETNVIRNMEEAVQKVRVYFDWKEPVKSIPSHRLLA